MDRKIDLINFLPPYIREYTEITEICNSENIEIATCWDNIFNVLKDQFISEATNNGVSRWEKILNITPKNNDSLDIRKFRIITRLNEKLPYTHTILEQQLITLCGEGGYLLNLDYGNYKIIVRVAIKAKENFGEVEKLLNRIAPVNMIIDLSLLYNQYQKLSQFTHSQLNQYTHYSIRNEVE